MSNYLRGKTLLQQLANQNESYSIEVLAEYELMKSSGQDFVAAFYIQEIYKQLTQGDNQ